VGKHECNELCGFGRMYVDILSMCMSTNSSPVKAKNRAVFIMKNLSQYQEALRLESYYE
jgi:hypothetical protein